MASAPSQPSSVTVQTANSNILVSWPLVGGATSYVVQRSLDNVTYVTITTLSGSPLATSYVDTNVTVGTQYWYQVAASNVNGTSAYTQGSQSVVPAYQGEYSLQQLRLRARQKADRVDSQMVTDEELNSYINRSMYELYDLLVTTDEDYYLGTPIQFAVDGYNYVWNLPNGTTQWTSGVAPNTQFLAPAVYKIKGCDLALNTGNNAYVTVNRFNFIDRNRFVYPNTASTIYGVFNLQYRLIGNNQIMFIPTPSGGQVIRIWYIPRLTELLQDTDQTVTSISGWIEYVITRAAMYILAKEESAIDHLQQEILYLKGRIEESAANRDQGQPDTISDTNQGNWANGWMGGQNGAIGGF